MQKTTVHFRKGKWQKHIINSYYGLTLMIYEINLSHQYEKPREGMSDI
jgi:hypothetical protein